ncbi:chain length determinant family protein [Nocardiopsis composta]|uniref:Capsular polysaccharide biosynthesis protein n=1 Tax=Nocardiopsis composta TaxID=157465 RepID=A0A7W8VFZ5_9ACTN|nr:chain length determinant family protein [Nocardiopsis composta]MBB5434484.1 capsular polysaccharide biosynthesis protein [Nocardiopsis composta]
MQTADAGPELRDYADVLRRRWVAVAAGAAGGLLVAVAAVLALPSEYASTTAVQVRPTGPAELTGERSGRTNGEVNLDTEAQVVRSTKVAAAAGELIGATETPDELRERVEITVPPNSSVLEIAYRGDSPEAARDGSAAFADAYLDYRGDRAREEIDARLDALRGEAEERTAELEELTGGGREAAPGDGEDTARQEAVQVEIADLNGEIAPLSALRASLTPGRVITPAALPESAASPRPVLWLGGGAMAGLAAGLAAAFGAEHRDRRLRTGRDVRRAAALPILLDTGAAGALARPGGRAVQRANEAAHALGARLGDGRRVLLAAGVSADATGSAAAVDLAAALARTGSDTLLVLADPGDDSALGPLGLDPGPGLAEALLGADPAGLELRTAAAPGLRVLRYGDAEAAELLQRSAMTGLLGRLRADRVVVAAAPLGERADALAMAAAADAVLPAVALGRTRAGELADALRSLDLVRAEVPGLLAAPAAAERSGAAPRTRGPAAAPRPAGADAPAAGAPAPSADRTDLPLPR